MDLFYCLNQVSLKLPSTQVLPLGNLHARATPVPQAVLGGGCILQNRCGRSGGRMGRRTRGLQDTKQVTPSRPLIFISATFAQVVQMHPRKEMLLPGMELGGAVKKERKKKKSLESQTRSPMSVLVLAWQAKNANAAPDNFHYCV